MTEAVCKGSRSLAEHPTPLPCWSVKILPDRLLVAPAKGSAARAPAVEGPAQSLVQITQCTGFSALES